MTRTSDKSLDSIDQLLLSMLREDARQNVTTLSQAAGVSRATVYARIARLEQDGIIDGYTIRMGSEHGRRLIRAHVMMTVRPKLGRETEKQLMNMPELSALHAISGAYDMIAIIEAQDVTELNDLIDHIGELDGVEKTTSSIILATKLFR